jgi:hypothetical protein
VKAPLSELIHDVQKREAPVVYDPTPKEKLFTFFMTQKITDVLNVIIYSNVFLKLVTF